ncbi:adipocyte plasma membrane-associated protein Hemomucin-like isoform X2 [Bacillus rossius redtenbacheri]|uniref:adipocyte plasma membrane-associated protein Hemomucin-like isoform X2 n=1 Tax=Bacillus rossius redtenbacheri TaxID=93214 RepID=UPI002FDEFE9F
MGSITKLVVSAVIVCLALTFLPGLPPHGTFTAHSVAPPMPLEGPLAPNTRLDGAEHLFEGEIKGPESFAVLGGALYTGVHGGHVVKILPDRIVPVAKFGKDCYGFWEEEKCGRPLGLKSGKDGFLYVVDAYYGVYKLNTTTGKSTLLVSKRVAVDGRKPQLPNSVDVASDGTLYWTDSSSDYLLQDGVYTLLTDGTGRLFQYNPKTNSSKVLIDKLQFANGVILSQEEDFVLVAETGRSRVHRYHLKGPKKGQRDIFLDGLPGLPDNLKPNGHGGFLVPLVASRDVNNSVLSQALGPYPLLRKFSARLLALLDLVFHKINHVFPNYFAQRALHWVGHFESIVPLTPSRVIVLDVNSSGQITGSLHCQDGTLTGISDIEVYNGETCGWYRGRWCYG